MTQIIEIAFETQSQDDWDSLEALLGLIKIPSYVKPTRDPPFLSLADVEAQCEGK